MAYKVKHFDGQTINRRTLGVTSLEISHVRIAWYMSHQDKREIHGF